jgi:hypothetical protein
MIAVGEGATSIKRRVLDRLLKIGVQITKPVGGGLAA